MSDEKDDLTAALRSRVRQHDGAVVIVAPDTELELFGEAAIIAAHDGLDPILVGRRFLTTLAASLNGALTDAPTTRN